MKTTYQIFEPGSVKTGRILISEHDSIDDIPALRGEQFLECSHDIFRVGDTVGQATLISLTETRGPEGVRVHQTRERAQRWMRQASELSAAAAYKSW